MNANLLETVPSIDTRLIAAQHRYTQAQEAYDRNQTRENFAALTKAGESLRTLREPMKILAVTAYVEEQ